MSDQDPITQTRPGCCWFVHMPRFPSEPPVYDSLIRHYTTLAEARANHLDRAREYAEEEEWPYIPVTVDDACDLLPVGFTQEDTPCRVAVCECDAVVHLQPGDPFECCLCSATEPVRVEQPQGGHLS
jgi:hypothetical protein